MNLSYIKNQSTVFISLEGPEFTLTGSFRKDEDPVQYDQVCQAIVNNQLGIIEDLISARFNLVESINKFGSGKLAISGGVLYYLKGDKPHPIDTTLTRRIQKMIQSGGDVDILVKFLENLINNPCQRAIQDFYDFLIVNDLVITHDGHFLAYKIVQKDFKDVYSGTMDNSPGQVVRMDRSKVDPDPNRTCSSGLHICSKDYLPQYGGFWGGRDSKIIVVKVNPAHVVAFPKDYANAKGRVCEYYCLGEFAKVEPEWIKEQIEKIEAGATINEQLLYKIIEGIV